jgi:hypothetical protein
MASNEQPEVEKPYVLIDFAAPQPARQGVAGHHLAQDGKLTGRIELYLIARSPLQVASGSFEVLKTSQGEEIVAMGSGVERRNEQTGRPQRQPVLPGSSLKGAFRSLVETISPSCVISVGRASRQEIPRPLTLCTKVQQLCPACRLFGMSGSGNENYMGQVHIADATLVDGGPAIIRTPLLWTPARGRGGLPYRYLKAGLAKGRKVYYHSLPARGPDARVALKTGSTLRTEIHFTNLTPGELGLLIAGLGLHPDYRFLPKIGAGKPVGMGSTETYIQTVELYGAVKERGRLGGRTTIYQGDALAEQIKGWVQAAQTEQLLREEALEQVADVLKLSNLKRLPLEGAY